MATKTQSLDRRGCESATLPLLPRGTSRCVPGEHGGEVRGCCNQTANRPAIRPQTSPNSPRRLITFLCTLERWPRCSHCPATLRDSLALQPSTSTPPSPSTRAMPKPTVAALSSASTGRPGGCSPPPQCCRLGAGERVETLPFDPQSDVTKTAHREIVSSCKDTCQRRRRHDQPSQLQLGDLLLATCCLRSMHMRSCSEPAATFASEQGCVRVSFQSPSRSTARRSAVGSKGSTALERPACMRTSAC